MKKEFLVQGSSSDPYKITIQLEGINLTALCDCPAGKNGMYCKHRFNILRGSKKNIVSGNENEVTEAASWLSGTDVEAAMNELMEIEVKAEEIKLELKAAKKLVASAMRD
jgi:uncharacterized Zn finger protein